jgi:hypothetical protein
MIPYILAALGGYLIGDSTKKKSNPLDNPYNILAKGGRTKYAYGGNIEYGVRVTGLDPMTGSRYKMVYDIEANSDEEAMREAKMRFMDDSGLEGVAEIVNSEEIVFADGGETDFKFTFKTDDDYYNARSSGYIDEYDIVRIEASGNGRTIDFPLHSEEQYIKTINDFKQKGIKINKVYPEKHYYDINDYYDPEDDRDDRDDDDYGRGGKVKFADKVKSIADRLDGTKVPKKLEKDYGKRYNRSEAEMAAKRIAGAQLKKLKE